MRLMGLDYGSKTVGVALSDPLGLTAEPFETIVRERPGELRKTLRRLEEIIAEKEVGEIVLGLPVHLSGDPSERSEATLLFRDKLVKRTRLPVHLMDERLTTVEAETVLEELEVPKKDWKLYVDKIAASLILKAYMSL